MKNIICLFAAASVMLSAGAQDNLPAASEGRVPESQYSEKGYKRPGKGQPEFAEKFINSGKEAPSVTEEPAVAEEPAAEPLPVVETPVAVEESPRPVAAPVEYDADNDIASLVRQACRLGVFVIRQPYGVVDDNGDFYALEEGKTEVGATYAPAYYIRGGYLFTDATLNPWNHDPAFRDLVEPGLKGQLLDASASADLSTGAEYDSLTFNAGARGNVYPGLLYSMRDDSAFAADGFYASSELGDLEGYIVWLVKSPTQELSSDTDLMVTASRKPITVSDDPSALYPLGKGVTNAVGAIYVTPEITGVGRFDLYLQGVGVCKDGEWSLIFPFTDFTRIFDAEQAVKGAVPESPRKTGKLRKLSQVKAAAVDTAASDGAGDATPAGIPAPAVGDDAAESADTGREEAETEE